MESTVSDWLTAAGGEAGITRVIELGNMRPGPWKCCLTGRDAAGLPLRLTDLGISLSPQVEE